MTFTSSAAPRIEAVSANAAYNVPHKAGVTILLSVLFDQAVDVDSAAGRPYLQLATGNPASRAIYLDGSGTRGLTFTYTVGAGDNTPDLDYSGTGALVLNGGSIRLAGTATDATLTLPTPGTAGSLGANNAIVLDTTAPNPPTRPDLHPDSDTGQANNDDITGATQPTFTGSAEQGATVTLYANGIAVGSAVAGAGGAWSITVDRALAGGDYVFRASATDRAGNVSLHSDPLPVRIITDAPASYGATFTLSDDSNIDGDNITNIASQRLEGKLNTELLAGEQIQVKLGATWHTAMGAPGSLSWTLDDVVLQEGTHEAEVRVLDAAGNAGKVTSWEYTLDTAAPTVTIGSASAALKAGESTTITFTFSEDPGAAFGEASVKVDHGILGPLSGSGAIRSASFTPDAGIDATQATISIVAGAFRDLAGNANQAAFPLTLDIDIDTLAPAAPSQPQLDSASDTGDASSDRVTAANRPTFTGQADSGDTVILYDADAREIGRATAVAGNWSITPVTAFADGSHTISARTLDAAGNLSAPVAGLPFTIDTRAPTVSISASTASLKIGESATITFRFSEAPGPSFMSGDIKVGGGTLGPLASTGPSGLEYSATFTPTAGVNAGMATFTIGAGTYHDLAGNAGASAQLPGGLAYDTSAPAAPSVPDLDPASDSGSSNSDNITGDTTPTFKGTAEAGAIVRLLVDGQEVGSGVATGGIWSITSSVLGAGQHQVTAIAVDAAGNQGTASDALAIHVVSGAPGTRVTSVALSDDTGALSSDFVTSIQAQVISGALGTALLAGQVVRVSVDGGISWITANIDSPTAWSVATALAPGAHTIVARVEDDLGTPGPETSQDYTLDFSAPGVSVSSSASTLKAGESATITFTFSEAPGASFSAAGIRVDGGKIGALGALGDSGLVYTTTFTPDAGVDLGSATISVVAGSFEDLAGNLGTAGSMPPIGFDTLAPDAPPAPALAMASDTGTIGDGVTTSTTQVIEGSGAEGGATIRLYDGNALLGSGQADADGRWSFSLKLAVGAHALRATELDQAGNESATSNPFALTVERASTPTPTPTPTPDPDPTPTPPTMIDGVPVTVGSVALPGGVLGTSIEVPIVTDAREESGGDAFAADIPLFTRGGATLLLGQLPVGYGLSASSGYASSTAAPGFLAAAIGAAMEKQLPTDRQHVEKAGSLFLSGIPAGGLVVGALDLVSTLDASGSRLTLSAPGFGVGTALLIDAGGLAPGSAMTLDGIGFAAIFGDADIHVRGSASIVAGDSHGQHFTVGAGEGSRVFAGGGSDVLSVLLPVDGGLVAGRATTTLHGGQGLDTATFAGRIEDFDVVFHQGHAVVNSKAAPDAQVLVVNVEQLQFSDGVVNVEIGAQMTTLAGMYQNVLGRQADMVGIGFWADQVDAGTSWGAIALGMIASSEGVTGNGALEGDNATDIGLLYQALFERSADAGGLAFWQAQMAGGMTLEQVATAFVESSEMVGQQRFVHDWDFLV